LTCGGLGMRRFLGRTAYTIAYKPANYKKIKGWDREAGVLAN
jgi:hypothetical protein